MNLSDIRLEMSADSRRGAPGLPASFGVAGVVSERDALPELELLFSKCRVLWQLW